MDSLVTHASVETRPRSLAKAISWRATGSIDTFIVSWFITGNTFFAGSIALTEIITKIVLYYFHERVWASVRWGRKSPAATHTLAPARFATVDVSQASTRATCPACRERL